MINGRRSLVTCVTSGNENFRSMTSDTSSPAIISATTIHHFPCIFNASLQSQFNLASAHSSGLNPSPLHSMHYEVHIIQEFGDVICDWRDSLKNTQIKGFQLPSLCICIPFRFGYSNLEIYLNRSLLSQHPQKQTLNPEYDLAGINAWIIVSRHDLKVHSSMASDFSYRL